MLGVSKEVLSQVSPYICLLGALVFISFRRVPRCPLVRSFRHLGGLRLLAMLGAGGNQQ